MNNMQFRSTTLQKLPYREWLRQNMPSSGQGFIVEDLDLIIRWYGGNFKQDATGMFMLVELKYSNSDIGIAQGKTFGLIDKMLRKSDPKHERYLGYFLLQYSDEDWSRSSFRINKKNVTREQFEAFLKSEYRPEPYFADEPPTPLHEQIAAETERDQEWLR